MEAASVNPQQELEVSPSAAVLRVQALPFFATIDVFDARFQRVAGTPGAMNTVLEYPVALGVYTVQFKVGETTEKQYAFVLEPGPTDILSLTSKMNFTAAAPVHSTLNNCNQGQLIAALSLTEPLLVAPGPATARLFLVARELSEGPQRWQSAFADVTLLNWQGDKILELQQVATIDEAGRYTGLHVALAPGAYRLRSGASPMQEVALYVAEERQTQVFFTLRSVYGHGNPHSKSRRLNLARSSVHIVRFETGFQPASSAAIATEAALRALETDQSVPFEALAQVVDKLHEHPMLGLYAARLHLRAPAPSLPLLRQVRDQLVLQLGSWPDVIALAADITALATDVTDQAALVALGGVNTLPMLASSWEALLRASSNHALIITPDSPAVQLAHTITLSYPTLVWNGQNRSIRAEALPADNSQPTSIPIEGLLTEQAPLNQLAHTSTLAALEAIKTSLDAAQETKAGDKGYRQPTSTWLDAFASKHLHGSDARIFEWVRYNPLKIKALAESLLEPIANDTIQTVTEALRLPWHSIQTGIERISAMLAGAQPPQVTTAAARRSEEPSEDEKHGKELARPDEFSMEWWYAELNRIIRSGLAPQVSEEENELLAEPVSYVRQLINLSTDPGRTEYLCQQALNTLTYNWLPRAPEQQAPQIARRLELMEAFRPTTGGALLLNLLLTYSPYHVDLDDSQRDTSGGDLHRLALRTLAAYWPGRVDWLGSTSEVPFEMNVLREQYDLYVGLLRSHLTSMEALRPYRRDAVGYLLRLNELTTGDAVLTEMLADKTEGIIPETINLVLSPGRRASLGVNLAAFYQQCREVSPDALSEFGKVLNERGYHLSLQTSSIRGNESAESYELPTSLGESLAGLPFWETSMDYGTMITSTSHEEADIMQRIVKAGPGIHLQLQEWADSTDSYWDSQD